MRRTKVIVTDLRLVECTTQCFHKSDRGTLVSDIVDFLKQEFENQDFRDCLVYVRLVKNAVLHLWQYD